MSIPQRADKWIVFGVMFAVGVAWLLRSSVPGGFTVTTWAVIPLAAAVIVTTFYVIWCAACRLFVRLLPITATAGSLRILANGSFLIMVALIVVSEMTTVVDERPTKTIVEEVVLKRPESDSRP